MTTPGIYKRLSFETYKQIEAVNASSLKPWLISPRYAKWREENPLDTAATMLGQAIHSFLLDDDFHEQYATLDDTQLIEEILSQRPDLKNVRNSKDYKDALKTFESLNKHKTILKWSDMETIRKVKRAISEHPETKSMNLGIEDTELTLVWHDDELKCLCKARLDVYDRVSGRAVDLKTMNKRPTFRAIERQVIDYAYHIQYAWYIRGMRACGLSKAPTLRFLFAQTSDEFDVAWADPDENMLDQGLRDAKDALARMKVSISTRQYPGVHPDPVQISLPDWALIDHEIIDDGTEVVDDEAEDWGQA